MYPLSADTLFILHCIELYFIYTALNLYCTVSRKLNFIFFISWTFILTFGSLLLLIIILLLIYECWRLCCMLRIFLYLIIQVIPKGTGCYEWTIPLATLNFHNWNVHSLSLSETYVVYSLSRCIYITKYIILTDCDANLYCRFIFNCVCAFYLYFINLFV